MSSSSKTSAAESAVPPIWLFKKRLNRSDASVFLKQLVVEECSEAMKGVLVRLQRERRYHYVRVMAKDPNGDVYELRLMHYARGTHVLLGQWGHIVAANGLKIGDSVEGWGNLVLVSGGGIYITCALDIRRQQPPESSRDRNLPSSSRKTPAKRDGAKNPKKEESKSVGGNEKIDSERNRLNSSPAIQESEQVQLEDIAGGENPEMKKGSTNPRETKKGSTEVGVREETETERVESSDLEEEPRPVESHARPRRTRRPPTRYGDFV